MHWHNACVCIAVGTSDALQLPFELVVLSQSIRHKDPYKIFEKFFYIVTETCFLVFIHNDVGYRIQFTCDMYPYVACAARRSAIIDDLQGYFITLIDMGF